MTDDNGGPPIIGGVPLGPEPETQMVTCIWHSAKLDHPVGAPPCTWHAGASQQVMALTSLLQWVTLTLTQLLSGFSGLAEQLEAIEVQVEALDATRLE